MMPLKSEYRSWSDAWKVATIEDPTFKTKLLLLDNSGITFWVGYYSGNIGKIVVSNRFEEVYLRRKNRTEEMIFGGLAMFDTLDDALVACLAPDMFGMEWVV